jgi:signal transduction histidine kinase
MAASMISMRNSIATRLLAVTFSIYFVVAVAVTLGHMKFEYGQAKQNILDDLKVFQSTFQPILSQMVWSINRDALHKTAEGIAEAPTVAGVRIIANGIDEVAVGTILTDQGVVTQASSSDKRAIWGAGERLGLFGYAFPIVYKMADGSEQVLGKAILYSSHAIVFQRVKYGFAVIILNAVIKTLALWLIFYWLSNKILRRPLNSLSAAVRDVDFVHLEQIRIELGTQGRNELKVLEEAFNGMIEKLRAARDELREANHTLERKVQERTEQLEDALHEEQAASHELEVQGKALDQTCRELEERRADLEESNRTLQMALDDLRTTQVQLVQSEKMASLGQLVAGIAHELNTPIGNALVTATILEAAAKELQTAMLRGDLRKSTLNYYVESNISMTELVTRSCARAADLISSFKQVAVDQTSEKRRVFDLRSLIEDNVAALRPSFRKAPWIIEIDVPADIMCDSYPGPLGQVIANVVQNCVLHAFAGRESGLLKISATLKDTMVELVFSDDGNGMPSDVLAHIFEPFYTTRLGQGGSGLGLSIVLNIVTGILGGTVCASSEPERGTRVVMTMALIAPRQVNEKETPEAGATGLNI